MTEEEKYPLSFTDFVPKTNAGYDGDPLGDYVMAEDVNELQEAIARLEKAIGLTKETGTLYELIEAIEQVEVVKVPEVAFYHPDYIFTHEKENIQNNRRYSQIAVGPKTVSPLLVQALQNEETKVALTLDCINDYPTIRKIEAVLMLYEGLGIEEVVLSGFGDGALTREEENDLLMRLTTRPVNVTLISQSWAKLFDASRVEQYNEKALPLVLNDRISLVIPNFAYFDERQYFGVEVDQQMAPFLKAKKEIGVKLIGNAKVANQKTYNYVNHYALLYSLDGLYFGEASLLKKQNTTFYQFPKYVSQWKSSDPIIYSSNATRERNIRHGRIVVSNNLDATIQGLRITVDQIEFLKESLSGAVIQENTLDPKALKTYDVDRVIGLINSQNENKISHKKIDFGDKSETLPSDIPAANMVLHVIEAINHKNDHLTSETQQIIDASIKNLDAQKLFGSFRADLMVRYVIQAINQSTDVIDIETATIRDFKSTKITTESFYSNEGTLDTLYARDSVTTNNLTVQNELSAFSGWIERLESLYIKTDQLEVKTLVVEDLQADNLKAIVIEAVEAEIKNGKFQTIVTNYLKSDVIKTDLINAINSMIGEAVIDGALIESASITNAHIVNLDANKLNAGVINTGQVTIQGPNGHLVIQDNHLQIYDEEDADGLLRKRIQLGDVSAVTGNANEYGLVVMGEDGQTILYDHTGVYNQGIKDNAISSDKLQDGSVDNRILAVGSVFAKNIVADAITSEKIKAGAITANKISAGAITAGSAIIAEAAIASAQILELHGSKVVANTITGEKIVANSITTDKLVVGYLTNKIKNGYDSFEQYDESETIGVNLSGAEKTKISESWAYEGQKSLSIQGNATNNVVLLQKEDILTSKAGLSLTKGHIVSAYAYCREPKGATVSIGLRLYNSQKEFIDVWSTSFRTAPKTIIRPFVIVPVDESHMYAEVLLRVATSNVEVFFDAIQIEEQEVGMTEPSWFRPVSTTRINGSHIETGRIDAKHIQIGSGTRFGDDNTIILSDEGFHVIAKNGTVDINGNGIEVKGGAFALTNEGKVYISGTSGIEVSSALNRIQINPNHGIQINKKGTNEVLFETDLEGNLYLKGRLEVTSSDTIYSKEEARKQTKIFHTQLEALDQTMDKVNQNLSNLGQSAILSIGMKVGYESFQTPNPNAIYFCGFEPNSETFIPELKDVNGQIKKDYGDGFLVVPKQTVKIQDAPPRNGYFVYDATFSLIYFVVFVPETEKWQAYNLGQPLHNRPYSFTESSFVIGELDLTN